MRVEYVRLFRFHDIHHNQVGKVVVLFAFMLVPLAITLNFSIDSARQLSLARQIQYAADAGALAGARGFKDSSIDTTDVHALALHAFSENMTAFQPNATCQTPTVTVDTDSQTVDVSATCAINSSMGSGLSGRSTLNATRSATGTAGLSAVDLALVLDISSSMSGSKVAAVQDAATLLIDHLLSGSSSDGVRIASIPYSSGVNAGVYGNLALGWGADDDRHADGASRVCVSERSGTAAFTDDAPEASKWVGPRTTRTSACPLAGDELVPLTNDADALKMHIQNLFAQGYTAGHVGLAWGWYALSPEWSAIWPAASAPLPYGNPDELKAVVLMTDGVFNEASVTAQGSALEQAEFLCNAMRAKGVVIYTVAFDNPGDIAENLMRTCASSADAFYEAVDRADLIATFSDIAGQFTGARLTQ